MARYIPSNVPLDDLAGFLRSELDRISQAIGTADDMLNLDTLYAQPNKFREGAICKADGTVWNPGSGAGVYCFYDGIWNKLG